MYESLEWPACACCVAVGEVEANHRVRDVLTKTQVSIHAEMPESNTWALRDIARFNNTPYYVIRQPLFLHHTSKTALAERWALLVSSRQRGAVKAALDAGRLESVGKASEWIATGDSMASAWVMSGV
jgi:hypothetical protein